MVFFLAWLDSNVTPWPGGRGGDMKLLHESQLKIMFASNLNYAFSSLLGNYIQPQQFILTRNQLGYL